MIFIVRGKTCEMQLKRIASLYCREKTSYCVVLLLPSMMSTNSFFIKPSSLKASSNKIRHSSTLHPQSRRSSRKHHIITYAHSTSNSNNDAFTSSQLAHMMHLLGDMEKELKSVKRELASMKTIYINDKCRNENFVESYIFGSRFNYYKRFYGMRPFSNNCIVKISLVSPSHRNLYEALEQFLILDKTRFNKLFENEPYDVSSVFQSVNPDGYNEVPLHASDHVLARYFENVFGFNRLYWDNSQILINLPFSSLDEMIKIIESFLNNVELNHVVDGTPISIYPLSPKHEPDVNFLLTFINPDYEKVCRYFNHNQEALNQLTIMERRYADFDFDWFAGSIHKMVKYIKQTLPCYTT